MAVTVLQVAAEKVPVSVDTVGQAEGSREVEIRARVNGILEKTPFPGGCAGRARADAFRDRRGSL